MSESNQPLATRKLWAIVLCLLLASFAQCEANENRKRTSVRICGVKLVNTLKKLCNHCYKEPTMRTRKRDVEQDELGQKEYFDIKAAELEEESEESITDALDGYIAKRFGNSKPSSMGIATRCCVNQCRWKDLKSYCCNPTTVQPEASI